MICWPLASGALLESTAQDRPTPERSPSLAAALSVLWPGLGQLYIGRRRLAVAFALPAVLGLGLVVYELRQGPVVFLARFADPAFSGAAAAIVLLLGAWQVTSIGQAFFQGRRVSGHRAIDRAVVVAVAAVVVIAYGGTGFLLAAASAAENHAFNPVSRLVDLTTPSPDPSASQIAGLSPTPGRTPSIENRVTILLNGVDAAPGRGETLYDSILVVSYDPKSNSIQMVSVPRDTASFPMYFGNHPAVPVTLRINSLPTYVHNGWLRSPDSPYVTLVKEISYLVGIPIDYYAVMDLDGFVRMIDAVGGIDIVNPSPIDDPVYATPEGTIIGYKLAAGPQHLNGQQALGYVRSRHGAGNSDWARDSRQQDVMVALLRKMAQPGELLALPGLISTLGSSVTTDFPANQVADYVAVGENVPSQNISQVVLGPPYTVLGINGVNSAATTCLLDYKVAQLSRQLFGKDSLWYGKPDPPNTCR
jgi:LCP family protein required for cell wall assembly